MGGTPIMHWGALEWGMFALVVGGTCSVVGLALYYRAKDWWGRRGQYQT